MKSLHIPELMDLGQGKLYFDSNNNRKRKEQRRSTSIVKLRFSTLTHGSSAKNDLIHKVLFPQIQVVTYSSNKYFENWTNRRLSDIDYRSSENVKKNSAYFSQVKSTFVNAFNILESTRFKEWSNTSYPWIDTTQKDLNSQQFKTREFKINKVISVGLSKKHLKQSYYPQLKSDL